ncbi:MAG: NUDIX hydrolase [Clostridiales bacterium]|nr:NUDIX hydrolase [Clostridiales bacterium]
MWIGGVRVVILDKENRILMVKQHHDEKDIWMVPGGGIEEGESSMAAAVREMKEETGLDVEIDRLIWHTEEVSARGQRFVNFFMGRIKGGELTLGADPEFDNEHQVLREVRFMSREEIEQVEHLYPEYLRDEFWRFLDEDYLGYNAFKVREKQ